MLSKLDLEVDLPGVSARPRVAGEVVRRHRRVLHVDHVLEDWAEEQPDAMKRWDASSDRHCELCRELDGQTVGVDEPFSTGHMHGPRHPNCRCIVTPWMKGWKKVKPLRRGPSKPVVTRGGTAKETNRVIERRRRRAA